MGREQARHVSKTDIGLKGSFRGRPVSPFLAGFVAAFRGPFSGPRIGDEGSFFSRGRPLRPYFGGLNSDPPFWPIFRPLRSCSVLSCGPLWCLPSRDLWEIWSFMKSCFSIYRKGFLFPKFSGKFRKLKPSFFIEPDSAPTVAGGGAPHEPKYKNTKIQIHIKSKREIQESNE